MSSPAALRRRAMRRAPRTPAAPANDRLARKSRRDCMMCIRSLPFPPRQPGRAHAFSSRLSSFRKRQSVPSAMSCVGARLDHADLVQPKREEAQRVLGVELAPAGVRDLGQRLQRVVVALREPALDQTLRGLLRLGGADSLALRRARSDALGGDRMIADELPVADHHAAEVLRPWLVGGGVEDHATDLAGAQLLRLGGKPRKASTFPSANNSMGNKPMGLRAEPSTHSMSL